MVHNNSGFLSDKFKNFSLKRVPLRKPQDQKLCASRVCTLESSQDRWPVEQWPLNISGNKYEMDTSTLLKSERICIIIPSLLCAPRASFTVTGLRRFRLCSVATDSLYRPASKKTCMLLYVSPKATHLGNGTDTR